VKFWDSSAILPLVLAEPTTGRMQRLYERDGAVLVWWATEVECVSAIARLERDRQLGERAGLDAFNRLDALRAGWHEIQPLDAVRQTARRLLRVHSLRAGDCLQLAAAIAGAEGHPGSLEVLTLDERLAHAARREGFLVPELEP
jgi:hypothetical protein